MPSQIASQTQPGGFTPHPGGWWLLTSPLPSHYWQCCHLAMVPSPVKYKRKICKIKTHKIQQSCVQWAFKLAEKISSFFKYIGQALHPSWMALSHYPWPLWLVKREFSSGWLESWPNQASLGSKVRTFLPPRYLRTLQWVVLTCIVNIVNIVE